MMKTTMIASVRTRAGLGSPPGRYTTNRNESINSVVQAFSDYTKSTWVDVNNKLYELVVGQEKEVERSIFRTNSRITIRPWKLTAGGGLL
jgi:hypothetical protein